MYLEKINSPADVKKLSSDEMKKLAEEMRTGNFGLKKEFLDRYDANEVLRQNCLTPEQIADRAAELIK